MTNNNRKMQRSYNSQIEAVNESVITDSRKPFEDQLRELGVRPYLTPSEVKSAHRRWFKAGCPPLEHPQVKKLEAECERVNTLLKDRESEIENQDKAIEALQRDNQAVVDTCSRLESILDAWKSASQMSLFDRITYSIYPPTFEVIVRRILKREECNESND